MQAVVSERQRLQHLRQHFDPQTVVELLQFLGGAFFTG